jgi:hypothetical protein
MKEATGELNMTVITVVAISAIAALFYAFVWPMVQRNIVQRTCDTYGTGYTAVKKDNSTVDNNGKTSNWQCCDSNNKCIETD